MRNTEQTATRFTICCVLFVVACSGPTTPVPLKSPSPAASASHLATFVGTWSTTNEFQTEPSAPMQQTVGRAVGRAIGDHWVVVEHVGTHFGKPFSAVLVIGHDATAATYTGNWFDSLSSTLTQYRGDLDPTGKILSLHSQQPSTQVAGATAEFQERIELTSSDQIKLTSQTRSGQDWITIVTTTYQRQR
jgi:hypothetical protein